MTKPVAVMDELDNGQRARRALKIGGLVLLMVFLSGVAAGFVKSTFDKGETIGTISAIILAAISLLALGSLWLLVRMLNRPTGEAPPTRKERLNRNILAVCGGLGFVMGMLMMITQGSADFDGLFSNEPLPPGIAIALLVLLGIVLPILSFIWHRSAVDEQEVDAYKTGALWGLNVFMLGAPIWWVAARGGFAPEPNVFILYFATIAVMGAVWMWKKYR